MKRILLLVLALAGCRMYDPRVDDLRVPCHRERTPTGYECVQ